MTLYGNSGQLHELRQRVANSGKFLGNCQRATFVAVPLTVLAKLQAVTTELGIQALRTKEIPSIHPSRGCPTAAVVVQPIIVVERKLEETPRIIQKGKGAG